MDTTETKTPTVIEGDGTTAQLCEWINKLNLSDIRKPVIERAKHLILDGIACGLVGARVPWSEQLVASVAAYEPTGKCSIIGYEEVSSLLILIAGLERGG